MFVYRFIFLVTTLTCVNNTLSAKSFKYLAHDLSQEQEVLLSQTFEHVYNIAENKLIIDYLSDVSAVIIFGLDSHQKSPGSYNRKKKLILFKDEKAINYHVLVEELFHAYQHQVISIGHHHFDQAHANIEFEAKVYADIVQLKHADFLIGELGISLQILGSSSENYLNWLKSMTNDFSKAPEWTVMKRKYYDFLEEFVKEKSAYNIGIDRRDQPISLFSIFQPDQAMLSRK